MLRVVDISFKDIGLRVPVDKSRLQDWILEEELHLYKNCAVVPSVFETADNLEVVKSFEKF